MINRVETNRRRKGFRYDAKNQLFIGYVVDIRVNGKRIRANFATKDEAKRFEANARLKRTYKKIGSMPPHISKQQRLSDLRDKRLALTGGRTKRRHLEKRVFNYFINLVGDKLIRDITKHDLKEFLRSRSQEKTWMGTPILPSTVDREITVIAAGLHSVSDMFEGYDDYRSPDIPRLKGTTLRRERILSIRESKAIIGFLSKHYPDVARAVEFAALTGLRRSEIAAVRKTDYDPDANSLQVYRSKTGETSHLWPLTPRMVELLTDDFYPNGEFVFSVSGKPLAMTYKALRAAGKHAGIPYGQYTPGGWVMHDLRHTFVTALQQGGADLATIKAFSGHSDSTLVLRYSHARPDSRKAAMDVIGQREVLINGNGKKADTGGNHTLAELFEDVRGGKIELEEFIKRVARSQ